MMPRDWDFFLDTSSIEDEAEREDYTLLYLADLVEEIKKFPALLPSFEGRRIEEVSGLYADMLPNPSWKAQFHMYEVGWDSNELLPVQLQPIKVQMIGRPEESIHKDPLTFLDTFDYAAVKIGLDFNTGKFVLHPSFVTFAETLKLDMPEDASSITRVTNWMARFWPASNIELVWADDHPFKPEKKKATSIFSTSDDLAIYRSSRIGETEHKLFFTKVLDPVIE